MAENLFLTGFPGFIAKRLVSKLAAEKPDLRFHFLVQSHLTDLADSMVAELDAEHAGLRERTTLYIGDITDKTLGLSGSQHATLAKDVTHVWHLAAIYDLAADESLAYSINVVGTKHVLDFAEHCTNLVRVDYVSTCYVSGKRKGLVLENELDEGQDFKNHYESTKCWAEVEVRKRRDALPIAIHRPSIVLGDSVTGETDKYDGPYYLILLLMRLPRWLPMVNIGMGRAQPNLVPVDYVVSAMVEIWKRNDSLGKTFALADPRPHSARKIVKSMISNLGRTRALGVIPSAWVEAALGLSMVRRAVKIPKEAIIYFNHEVQYDTSNTQAIADDAGLLCPDLLKIMPTLIDYVESNPQKSFLDDRAL